MDDLLTISVKVRCVQLDRQLLDDSLAMIRGDHFDIGFDPGTKRTEERHSVFVGVTEQLEVTADAEPGLGAMNSGMPKVEQGIGLVSKAVAERTEQLIERRTGKHGRRLL
jgi:hypothetical protein